MSVKTSYYSTSNCNFCKPASRQTTDDTILSAFKRNRQCA